MTDSTPTETLWSWVKTAPLPVVLALMLGLAGWVYAVDNQVTSQREAVILAAERVAQAKEERQKLEVKLDQVQTDVKTVLQAVMWLQATQKAEEKARRKDK